jgi:hypothetical protein
MPWNRIRLLARAGMELRDIGTERIDVIELGVGQGLAVLLGRI